LDADPGHLQRVRHKLPVNKFSERFQFVTPVSFPEATRRTVAWLETQGLAAPRRADKAEYSKASNA
jgi:hypothetical protein